MCVVSSGCSRKRRTPRRSRSSKSSAWLVRSCCWYAAYVRHSARCSVCAGEPGACWADARSSSGVQPCALAREMAASVASTGASRSTSRRRRRASSVSAIVKRGSRPRRVPQRRRKRTHTAWKVPSTSRRVRSAPIIVSRRARISFAARFVNVTTTHRSGAIGAALSRTRCATRDVSTRVLPDPGPARICRGRAASDVTERADGAEEGGAQGVRVCEVREERHLCVLRGVGELLRALGADAALGHVEDAQDGGGVGGVVGEREVREEVADLGAVEEADAAEEAVRDVEAVEDAFERAAVRGEAEQDAHVRVRRGAGVLADFARDKEGLVVGVVACHDADGRAACEGGVQALGEAVRILLHDAEGGLEDLGRAAVVFFEEDAVQAGEVEVHALDVAYVGVAPAVDALVGVADDADVAR